MENSNALKTVGQILREAREAAGLTLEKFADLTLVPVKHLMYLEEDKYASLPPDVYTKAMIQKYSDHFGLDREMILQKFLLGHSPRVSGSQDLLPANRYQVSRKMKISLSIPHVEWHPGFIFFILGALWLLLQSRVFFFPPKISFNPPELIHAEASTVVLAGRVGGARVVTINDAKIDVGKRGHFEQELTLFPGLNLVEVRARNYLGKESKITKYIMYEPKGETE